MANTEKKTKSLAPEFLVDLQDHSKQVLTSQGVKKEDAEKWSRMIAKRMTDVWGGSQIYFPQGLSNDLTQRDLKIWNDFNGDNHHDLHRKYNISVQQVYAVIRKVRQSELAKRQGELL